MKARALSLARHPAFVVVVLLLAANGARRLRSHVAQEPPSNVVATQAAWEDGFLDISPTWSHDGRRIAFLRVSGRGVAQLCVAPAGLSRVVRLFGPETINPDRPLRTGRLGWASPERIAWSPNDDEIAFPRAEWFSFREGYSLPGTALWSYQFRSARVAPLVLHPQRYHGSLFYYRSPVWRSDSKGVAAIGEGLLGVTALLYRQVGGMPADGGAVRYDRFLETDWPAWHPGAARLALAQGIRRALTAGRIETIRVIEPGGLIARSALIIGADQYMRLCPDDVAQHQNVSVQPRVSGLCWSLDGSRVLFALTPDANDLLRSSIWSVAVDRGPVSAPERVSPAGAFGYAVPRPTARATVLAARTGTGGLFAAEIGRQGDVRLRCRLASDDFDWSPDGSAVVVSNPEPCNNPARPCLRVSRWGR